jgi:glycosyltransferase involved in cell wall biosynthesis
VNVGIHQVLVAASAGDAITNMARAMQKVLRQVGPSEIYAHHIAPALINEVQPLTKYRARHSRNILIFHASIGQPQVHDFLAERHEPIVLVYHNVTPASYFEPYDIVFAELLTLGRRDVERLRPRVCGAIAASEFNARELEAMGYRDVRVVPPAIDIRHLTAVEPRPSTVHHLEMLAAPKLLCIAQVMPHKRPDFLVQAMHIVETYLGMKGFLLLVGPQRLERYARAIREQVQELNLVGVHLVGSVDDADLAAMLRAASVVVTASEHEGFCMPLVEAMTFDTPVLARACAAIPETVGDAGLLLPQPAGPTLFAEAITELLANKPLQADLVARGRRRIAELEAHPPDAAILETVLAVA